MAFVVQWTPIGPEMSVSLSTSEEVAELMRELEAPGRALDIRIVEEGEPSAAGAPKPTASR
ncbi:hypothetical protein [Chenggangzhangella methanolivorans]|uniref:Uncharacterized protein n=1 Tax=Chenggangzhangella methanolivorans TaxID=1437009 RepID=A0A9E6R869_9HYPH|nr:hypothetical protein [Chenggangzhangella methanolivorans]QZN98422.1 hypothetical protein K6K41_15165 [Chenggangzhangella methanolivorans]